MDLETLQFLLSPAGDELFARAKSLDGSFLQRVTILRKDYPAPAASAALELLDLRRRAERKFSRAGEMFFTREALEQASGEIIANYRAARFPQDARVLDLACGIGGDTIALTGRCFVTAVDRDPVRLEMVRRNVEVYGLADKVTFVCADVTEIPLDADAAFLDPSRRVEGRRVVRLAELEPSIDFIRRLIECIPNTAIKLSPAADDSELESLGGEIEFISESGECKEAVVWLGELKTASKRATILPGEHSMREQAVDPIPIRPPGKFLYEPNPCIIRAHFVEQAAQRIGAWKIDPRIAYLSGDTPVETPFATGYEVLDSLPFNLKALNRRLRELDAGKVIVKKRGVPYDPIEIERRLKLKGSREFILILTRISDKPHAFVCKAD